MQLLRHLGLRGFEGYRIEPANAEATQFHLSKEDIFTS